MLCMSGWGQANGLSYPLRIIEFGHRLIHSHNIFRRNIGQNIVDGVKNIAAAWGKDIEQALDVFLDFSRGTPV